MTIKKPSKKGTVTHEKENTSRTSPLGYGGLDVDSNLIHVCLLGEEENKRYEFASKPTAKALCDKLRKYIEMGYELRLCYEATYLGFSLFRDLERAGFKCDVIAPSLIPEKPGNKVKTDRLDSRELAQYYQQGLLTKIYIPNKEDEVVRDLIRSRDGIVGSVKRIKSHMLSLCCRMGINYREAVKEKNMETWTKTHRAWLGRTVKGLQDKQLKFNLEELLSMIERMEESISNYDQRIRDIGIHPIYEKRVKALTCYRGIEVLTAMRIITELGDIQRFTHPKQLTSYIGMDICEYSSGGHKKRFGITKMGNANIRTAVIESCQVAHTVAKVSQALKRRRVGVDKQYIEIADRCMKRLHKKSLHLMYRGKHHNKVKVACAREMLGFIWESLRKAA